MKKNIVIVNAVISIIAGILLIFGLMRTFAFDRPKYLIEETGTVTEFRQHDDGWLDFVLNFLASNGSKGDYFRVKLEGAKYSYEATGVPYDLIDRALFKDLQVGEEIKIVRSGGSWSPNKIYAIEYQGKEYLSLDDVLATLDREAKIWHIVGPIIAAVALLGGGIGLFIVNYKNRKSTREEKKQKKFL